MTMQTVAETAYFSRRAVKRMTAGELWDAITMIASDPLCGDLIKETGGLRKVRFAVGSKGKSGGVRIVYYWFSENAPIFLLDVFKKGERDNLSEAERNELAALAGRLRASYRRIG
jgi:hypothetical protein